MKSSQFLGRAKALIRMMKVSWWRSFAERQGFVKRPLSIEKVREILPPEVEKAEAAPGRECPLKKIVADLMLVREMLQRSTMPA